jgi:hypothetical protein
MPGVTNLPLTTLQNGATVFGPANVANPDTLAVTTLDRTVAGGLNSLTSATTLEILVEQSNDGGATWFLLTDGIITGGLQPAPKGGGNATQAFVDCEFEPGTSRRVRATFTVVNGPVTVQGTLTVS